MTPPSEAAVAAQVRHWTKGSRPDSSAAGPGVILDILKRCLLDAGSDVWLCVSQQILSAPVHLAARRDRTRLQSQH